MLMNPSSFTSSVVRYLAACHLIYYCLRCLCHTMICVEMSILEILNEWRYVLFHLQHRERTVPVLIIGILVFIPGFYHLRIAYYAYKGYRGYSYDDIPDFDDWATWNSILLAFITDLWNRRLHSCGHCVQFYRGLYLYYMKIFLLHLEKRLVTWASRIQYTDLRSKFQKEGKMFAAFVMLYWYVAVFGAD